jgi:hypothetical protein
MATKKPESLVYATARVCHDRSSRYGHIYIYVYELFGYNGPTIKISCQTGSGYGSGEMKGTYAWDYGVSSDHNLVKLPALKTGYYMMKRVEARLNKKRDTYGQPKDYATFAAWILEALDVPRVHILESINGQLAPGVNFDSLPSFHPAGDQLDIIAALQRMEVALLNM